MTDAEIPAPKPSTHGPSTRAIVEVIGELPYYVPIPEGAIFTPTLIGAEPFQLEFAHFKPLRHPEDSQGENIDDRMGTFIRSRVRVLFPMAEPPIGEFAAEYEAKALSIANRALTSVRYKAYDHTIRHVPAFSSCLVRLVELDGSGKPLPEIRGWQRSTFGPFGIRPTATLTQEALRDVSWHFTGLSPIHPPWLLVLDAKYHSAVGDWPRACLDLGTALEINMEHLIDLYAYVNPSLSLIDFEDHSIFWKYDECLRTATGHSLHESPDLFADLEYIWAIRNSVAHKWKVEFRISSRMSARSRYLHIHAPRDGTQINSRAQVDALTTSTETILSHSVGLFRAAHPGF